MELAELKKQILENNLRSSYIFTGEELALQDVYINKISEVSKNQVVRINSLNQIYSKLRSKTLIKLEPKIYVIRDDEEYPKAEKHWNDFINNKSLKGNIIILLFTSLDKRSKFYKSHEPMLVEFDLIGESILRNRLQAITKWPIDRCQDFVKICGCNYGRIQNELYNVNILAELHGMSLLQVYDLMRSKNLIHEDVGDIIFDFSNAVLERNVKLSYDLLNKLEKTDEGPVKLLSVLYNSFRNVLMIQCTPYKSRTEEVLGMPKGQIYALSQKCDRYGIIELVEIIKLIQKIEEGIKTGLVDMNYSVKYLLSEIF